MHGLNSSASSVLSDSFVLSTRGWICVFLVMSDRVVIESGDSVAFRGYVCDM